MKNIYDYLIIGGGIAGTTAAETIRSKDPRGTIAIVECEPYFLYSRVMLDSFIKNKVPEQRLIMRSLNDYEKKRIDIYPGIEVDFVDFEKKEAHLPEGKILNYKKILISSGGRVSPWPFEEAMLDRIIRLQTLDDARRIKNLIEKFKEVKFKDEETGEDKIRPGKVLIVGGSFISLEMIDIFDNAGFDITLILRKKRLWEDVLDDQGFGEIYSIWQARKIEVILEDEIESLSKDGDTIKVSTKKLNNVRADLIGVGVGLSRNVEFLRRQLDVGRGIKVNKYLESSRENVWAAGDVAEYPCAITGQHKLSGSWTEAFMQGSIAGKNMALSPEEQDQKESFEEVLAYSRNHMGVPITFIGEVRALKENRVISRLHSVKGEYIRFFIKDNILTGAILINAQLAAGLILKLVKERKNITSYLENLSDPAFDLTKIEI